MLADGLFGSTRETALPYNDGMRSPIILIPLLFILADGAACKNDEPTGADFGEPCGGEMNTSCADGLECSLFYCEEKCSDSSECRPVEGFERECALGVCHIRCDENNNLACPQSLETPLECAQAPWCSGVL